MRRVFPYVGDVLFALGAALGLVFLQSLFSWVHVALGAVLVTGARVASRLRTDPRLPRRIAGWVAFAFVVLVHALLVYLAIAWGGMLAWAVAPWARGVIGLLAALSLAGFSPRWRFAKVPIVLPIGAWIAACLFGWVREEGYVRCDDLARALADPSVTMVVPTSRAAARCRPGASIVIGRYPRSTWVSPSGDELIFTTQRHGLDRPPPDDPGFDGSVCAIATDGASAARCTGAGKAQGIVDVPAIDRVFVVGWGEFPGDRRGLVTAIRRSPPYDVVGTVTTRESVCDCFYSTDDAALHCMTDEGFELATIRASDLEVLPTTKAPIAMTGMIEHDPATNRGVLCSTSGPFGALVGGRFLAVAVEGANDFRWLGGSWPLVDVATSWGCAWDEQAGRVHVVVPNLGALVTVDYRSGAVLDASWAGLGLRWPAIDPGRNRLYATSFLSGDLVAFDLATRRETARWFVGRYARQVSLARDGRSLLVASNLGILRVRL